VENRNDWIVIAYKLSSLPSRIRVHVWRTLKKAGAIHYQQGVAMLPRNERFLQFMQELKSEISSYGGEAVLAQLNFMDKRDDQNAVNEFNESLSQEYFGIKETGSKIWNEVEISRKDNLLNLAFLEDSLSTLKKLKSAYEAIKLRDCFKVSLRERIDEQIESLLRKVEYYYNEFKKAARPVE
jgi:hypothetical protein